MYNERAEYMKSVGKTTKYEEEKEPTFIREH